MQFDPDNPKWTAYVLGELDDTERHDVEAALAQSAEARQFVAELRRTVDLLTADLVIEPAAGLTAIQRAAILAGDVPSNATVELAPRRGSTQRSRFHVWYQAGAVALVAMIGVTLLLPGAKPVVESARTTTSIVPEPTIQNDTDSNKVANLGLDLEKHYSSRLSDPKGEAKSESLPQSRPVVLNPTAKGPKYTPLKTRYETKSLDGTAPAEAIDSAQPVDSPVDQYHLGISDRAPQPNQASARGLQSLSQPAGESEVTVREERANLSLIADLSRSEGLADAIKTDGESLATIEGYINAEDYDQVTDNAFLRVSESPLSTFSIDVDTASYSNIRRFLTQNRRLPPKGAVRIEEMINYFRYDYPQPEDGQPFSTHVEVAGCPWNAEHRLVKIGLKGREVKTEQRPKSNLVFLLDVSGSMNEPNKLPLVKEAMRMLTGQLTENDRVAIVVYAGGSGLVLPSTTGNNRETIISALDRLEAGGSTNGAQGIQIAYELARQNFIKGATNRVILATDGDFNVGITDRGQLIQLITEEAKSGVFLTTLGFGMGNLKDGTLEQLADKGNGNYAYIDDLREARKVFVEEMSGTLVTIAKDVKIQIEFNPQEVEAFRLIGYENRILAHQDFNDDKKDAGEIGAGHTVTALYELVPKGKAVNAPAIDELKYQKTLAPTDAANTGELLTLKLRYKQPDEDTSKLIQHSIKDAGLKYGQASRDYRFAAGVALFGMLLRDSPYKGTASWDAAIELAQEGVGSDLEGYRIELVDLIKTAKQLAGK